MKIKLISLHLFVIFVLFLKISNVSANICSSYLDAESSLFDDPIFVSLEVIPKTLPINEETESNIERLRRALQTLGYYEKKIFILHYAYELDISKISKLINSLHIITVERKLRDATAKVQAQVKFMKLTPAQVIQEFIDEQIGEAKTDYKEKLEGLIFLVKETLQLMGYDIYFSEFMTEDGEYTPIAIPKVKEEKERQLRALGEMMANLDHSTDISAKTIVELKLNKKNLIDQLAANGHLLIDRLKWNKFPVDETTLITLHSDWDKILTGKYLNILRRKSEARRDKFRYLPH